MLGLAEQNASKVATFFAGTTFSNFVKQLAVSNWSCSAAQLRAVRSRYGNYPLLHNYASMVGYRAKTRSHFSI